jgi:hypothetical protein
MSPDGKGAASTRTYSSVVLDADQIFNFGPGKNHWCTRLEAKHGFIKALPVNISSQINGTTIGINIFIHDKLV